jgi:hypothetical protein
MWLQLGLAAMAGGTASTRVDVYTDEWIDVVMPAVEVGYEGEKVNVEGGYAVDVLSGATPVMVDTVSSATHFAEERHQAEMGMEFRPKPTFGISGGYGLSSEPDYAVHDVALGANVDLFERMSTAGITYRASAESMTVVSDDDFLSRAFIQGIDLSWAQILDKKTKVTFTTTGEVAICGEEVGCYANPYRYVPLINDNTPTMSLKERNPSRLYRAAAGLQLARALGRSVALHGAYRFYADSWRITGHTGKIRSAISLLDERLILRNHVRLSSQDKASFYRSDYDLNVAALTVPDYRTNDRELSGLFTVRVGGGAEWAWHSVGPLLRLAVGARLAHAWYRYPNYPELPARNAWLAGGGLDVEF